MFSELDPTRWNSAYMMFQRFVDLIQSINTILLDLEEAPAVLTAVEVSSIKEILPILQMFNDITVSVSAEKSVTISKLLAVQDFLLTNISSMNPTDQFF